MTFRTRLQIALAALAVASVGSLAFAVRIEMTRRLTKEYQARVTSLVAVIQNDLVQERDAIGRGLATVAATLADDNRFRVAVAGVSGERGYVLDYAGRAMRLAGLTMLQIQDPDGRILSSGHFRNEFDRLEPDLPRLLASAPRGLALVEARTPEGSFLALARSDSARAGGAWLKLVGGRRVDQDFLRRLARGQDLVVTLESPAGAIASVDRPGADSASVIAHEVMLPFVMAGTGGARLAEARLRVTHALTPLAALRTSVDRWSLLAALLAAAAAIVLATWASARLSRPLAELAEKTATLDLARLDVDFASQRTDEVGTLSRLLGAMTERLRRGTQQLREAERRATVGEVARQVNHDVKNGLVPIRNVLRHLAEVAERRPEELPQVFRQRKATLDSGVQYLETLAANYARLSPTLDGGSADVRAVVDEVVRAARLGNVALKTNIAPDLAPVRGDAVVLRRILENLVGNAVDAVNATEGPGDRAVVVTAEPAPPVGSAAVRVTVTDTGPGMTAPQLERAFEDFYTTKPGGTGLGLSIVRRLVLDLEGSLKVRTEPGSGTSVELTLPCASNA